MDQTSSNKFWLMSNRMSKSIYNKSVASRGCCPSKSIHNISIGGEEDTGPRTLQEFITQVVTVDSAIGGGSVAAPPPIIPPVDNAVSNNCTCDQLLVNYQLTSLGVNTLGSVSANIYTTNGGLTLSGTQIDGSSPILITAPLTSIPGPLSAPNCFNDVSANSLIFGAGNCIPVDTPAPVGPGGVLYYDGANIVGVTGAPSSGDALRYNGTFLTWAPIVIPPVSIQTAYDSSQFAIDTPVLTLDDTYRGFDIRDTAVGVSANSGTLLGVFDTTGTLAYLVSTADNLFGLGTDITTVTGTQNVVLSNGSSNITTGSNNFIFAGSVSAGTVSDGIAIGDASSVTTSGVAIGLSSNTTGVSSVCIGTSTIDNGVFSSVVIGDSASVITGGGSGSVAIGMNAVSGPGTGIEAVAIGPNTSATADSSTAMGIMASASGTSSIALGITATANGTGSIALGESPSSSGSYTVAIGTSANSTLNGSIAIGRFSQATDDSAIAIGQGGSALTSAIASASNTIAIGQLSAASFGYAIAIGYNTVSSSEDTVCIGRNAISSSTQSVAIGGGPFAGDGAEASGPRSIGIGTESSATGNNVIAIGRTSTASTDNAISIGSYAVASGTDSIAIGGGSGVGLGAVAAATNAIGIGRNCSAAAFGSIVIGEGASSAFISGSGNISIGIGTVAGNGGAHTDNIAIGQGALASTNNAIAIGGDNVGGQGAQATANRAISIGYNTDVSAVSSIAIGESNTITGTNSAIISPTSTVQTVAATNATLISTVDTTLTLAAGKANNDTMTIIQATGIRFANNISVASIDYTRGNNLTWAANETKTTTGNVVASAFTTTLELLANYSVILHVRLLGTDTTSGETWSYIYHAHAVNTGAVAIDPLKNIQLIEVSGKSLNSGNPLLFAASGTNIAFSLTTTNVGSQTIQWILVLDATYNKWA